MELNSLIERQRPFCIECKGPQVLTATDREKDVLMMKHGLCIDCDFWLRIILMADDPNQIRIRGRCYYNGDPKAEYKGFGGAHHLIIFKDGRQLETNNLWFNGEIPERFKARLPENAKFHYQLKKSAA